MAESTKMICSDFEALLSDAVEGTLGSDSMAAFKSHAEACATCGPLFAEALEGHRFLKSLAEVEPPASLVSNILIATTGIDTSRSLDPRVAIAWPERLREQVWASIKPVVAFVQQPRFVMSFGMVFFAVSMSLALAGVKVKDIRHADLRPSAIKRSYYETSGRVVKYYENIRFVYEIESRVREFKKATEPAPPADSNDKRHTNDTSQEPEHRQQRYYSQSDSTGLLADGNLNPDAIMADATRRLS